MKIFLAGGYNGNLRPLFDAKYAHIPDIKPKDMNIFLAGTYSRINQLQDMKVFLAGEHPVKNGLEALKTDKQNGIEGVFILESFYYVKKNVHFPKLIPLMGDFLLDSGAFTFMSNNCGSINWDGYVEDYARFINGYNIDKFLELDIDSLVGIKEVERLRAKLESLTGKQSIPVWHPSRGKDYYDGMVKDYSYVAYGGLLTDGINRVTNEKAFPYFINKAHENNCKIHGLGYTSCSMLRKFHFDSVDSTAWLYGNRGGFLYRFNPQKADFFDKINVPAGKRLSSRKAAKHNFDEWVKFQKYAYKYL